ncbi:MAG: hypothetical protein ACOYOK_06350 [Pseudobdellovibrionaceae bacterium]
MKKIFFSYNNKSIKTAWIKNSFFRSSVIFRLIPGMLFLSVLTSCGNQPSKLNLEVSKSPTSLINGKAYSCAGSIKLAADPTTQPDITERYFRISRVALTWTSLDTDVELFSGKIKFKLPDSSADTACDVELYHTVTDPATGNVVNVPGITLCGIDRQTSQCDNVLKFESSGTNSTIDCRVSCGGISLTKAVNFQTLAKIEFIGAETTTDNEERPVKVQGSFTIVNQE